MRAVSALEKLITDPTLALAEQIDLLQHINEVPLSGTLLTEYVDCVRRLGKQVDGLPEQATDIVGTGADGSHSFNVSTAAAFVIAGANIPVAKHGNRSTSSLSGSFDCLQALNVDIPEQADAVQRQMTKLGISFLFAPFFYPALAPLAPARKNLAAHGQKNIFQVLGPLLHPGRVKYQVIGVYSAELLQPVAEAMQQLGIEKGAVVHSAGLDELCLNDNNQVLLVEQQGIQPLKIDIQKLGFKPCTNADLTGGGPEDNAKTLQSILQNVLPGAITDTVLLNAAMAIYLHQGNLEKSLKLARESLRSGAAYQKLLNIRRA